jgi:hypothetical protein
MLPGERFNDLYNILIDIITSNIPKHVISNFLEMRIPYWNEIAYIRLTYKDSARKDFTIIPLVKRVHFCDDVLDFEYLRGQEPTLESWLIRPNVERCVIELEKTIIMLN